MTVIAVLKDGIDTVIGTDSMTTIGNIKSDKLANDEQGKFIVKKIPCYGETSIKIVIGLAGDPVLNRYINLVFTPPRYDLKKDFYTYLLDKFVPAFKKLLTDKHYIKKDHEKPDNEASLLIIHNNTIFEMYSDFSIYKYGANFMTTGSGWQVAIGSLYSTDDIKDSEERVRMAVQAAIDHTVYCGGKVWVNKVSNLIKE